MATRFHGRTNRDVAPNRDSEGQAGFGEWWGAIAVISLAAMAIVSLSGADSPDPITPPPSPAQPNLAPLLLEAIEPAERSLEEIAAGFELLCQAPVLLALELEPDCETGVITLPDSFFGGFGSATLAPRYQEDVAAAMRTYLDRLRRIPVLWDSLEAIELRGHSDPRAVRTPYTTNLIGSQQRPLGVLLFLMGQNGLSPEDQAEIQRLVVVSGVSFSRPPAECPESTRECYPKWRRVEIRPVLSESRRREDWIRTVEHVRVTARRIGEEPDPKEP